MNQCKISEEIPGEIYASYTERNHSKSFLNPDEIFGVILSMEDGIPGKTLNKSPEEIVTRYLEELKKKN